MALLLDAGALYAQADRADPHHGEVAESSRLNAGRGSRRQSVQPRPIT
jgi:hypothetical protein